jgi:hypothetical protein
MTFLGDQPLDHLAASRRMDAGERITISPGDHD